MCVCVVCGERSLHREGEETESSGGIVCLFWDSLLCVCLLSVSLLVCSCVMYGSVLLMCVLVHRGVVPLRRLSVQRDSRKRCACVFKRGREKRYSRETAREGLCPTERLHLCVVGGGRDESEH